MTFHLKILFLFVAIIPSILNPSFFSFLYAQWQLDMESLTEVAHTKLVHNLSFVTLRASFKLSSDSESPTSQNNYIQHGFHPILSRSHPGCITPDSWICYLYRSYFQQSCTVVAMFLLFYKGNWNRTLYSFQNFIQFFFSFH